MHTPRGWTNADAVAATPDFLAQPAPRRATIRELMKAEATAGFRTFALK
jgi:hypothetical protein